MSADNLLPCPFCGGAAEISVGEHSFNGAKVICTNCFAEGTLFGADAAQGCSHVSEAIAAWNRRAAPAIPDGYVLVPREPTDF